MEYEKLRLSGHPMLDKIEHVAIENVAAGFDILSFNNTKEPVLSRKIEVKSWLGKKLFYFSAKEYEIADEEKENYYLYLVDRKGMTDADYSPDIIQNPVANLFRSESDWQVEPDGWKIEYRISRSRLEHSS